MKFARFAAALAVAAAFISVPRPAPAASDPWATVKLFVDSFNKGDIKTALAQCAAQTQIIDEFPPHQWTTCASWAAALDAASKAEGDTDEIVTLGKPWHVDVTGDVAYVVTPVNYNFKEHGKPMGETNSVLTVRLKKSAAGWLVTAWTWSKH